MKYIELAFAVVCVVAVIQVLGRRLPVPMAALQITAGVALSAVATLDALHEQSSLLFVMLVPPLLYMEAWQVPKRELLRSIKPVLGLAIGLVSVTIVVVGFGVHAVVPQIPLAVSFALAAALASTDSVAVGSLVQRLPLPPRLLTVLSGEALFNDAVALVAFQVAVTAAVTSQFSAGAAAVSLVTVSAGGLVAGTAVAVLASFLRRGLMTGSDDGVRVDTTLSLLTPYAAYLAAEKLGVSGVLAVVAAGLCAGVLDRGQQRATTRLHGRALWSTVAPTLSGAVFVMLGLEMRQVLHRVEGHGAWTLVGYVIGLALTLFAVRMAWTMFSAGIAQRTPTVAAETLPGFGTQLVAVLCGVRGSLALTAALSIPLVTAASTAMPGRDLVVFLTAGTIAVTLLLSGVTLPFLKPGPLIENTVSGCAWQARVATTRVALQVIESDPVVAVSPRLRGAAMALKRLYASRLAALESADAETIELHRSDFAAHRRLSMNVLSAQRRELARLRSEGALTEAAMHEIELDLNLAEIVVDRLEWRGAAAA